MTEPIDVAVLRSNLVRDGYVVREGWEDDNGVVWPSGSSERSNCLVVLRGQRAAHRALGDA